jgi:hypothetical protein
MLFMEIIGVYCESNAKHTATICGQKAEISMLKQAAYRELAVEGLIL